MQYRVLGRTGLKVSALGFGGMRFKIVDGHVDEDVTIAALRRAMDLGVNYFDSAVGYCESESEAVMGKALKGRRADVIISTKYPTWDPYTKKADDCRRMLEQSLTRFGVDLIDIYHMHSVNWESAQAVLAPGGAMEGARKAKEEGLIRHLAFSFHDDAKRMIDIIDAAPDFEVVTCQYNLLDRGNEESIAYAHEKGVGVVVMDIPRAVEQALAKLVPLIRGEAGRPGISLDRFPQLGAPGFVGFLAAGEANNPEGIGHLLMGKQMITGRY